MLEVLQFVSFKNYEADLADIKEQLLRLDTLELVDPLGIEFTWQFFVHHPNMFKLITKLMHKVCVLHPTTPPPHFSHSHQFH